MVAGAAGQPEGAGGADAEDGGGDLDHCPEAELEGGS